MIDVSVRAWKHGDDKPISRWFRDQDEAATYVGTIIDDPDIRRITVATREVQPWTVERVK